MSRNLKPVEAVGLLIMAGIGIWWYQGGGAVDAVQPQMQAIESHMASDAVTQYGIAKRNGSKMDACTAAQGVTEAYLQAKDEANYAKWQKIQQSDCAAAGMPDQ